MSHSGRCFCWALRGSAQSLRHSWLTRVQTMKALKVGVKRRFGQWPAAGASTRFTSRLRWFWKAASILGRCHLKALPMLSHWPVSWGCHWFAGVRRCRVPSPKGLRDPSWFTSQNRTIATVLSEGAVEGEAFTGGSTTVKG